MFQKAVPMQNVTNPVSLLLLYVGYYFFLDFIFHKISPTDPHPSLENYLTLWFYRHKAIQWIIHVPTQVCTCDCSLWG